jgi:hypothetical protein
MKNEGRTQPRRRTHGEHHQRLVNRQNQDLVKSRKEKTNSTHEMQKINFSIETQTRLQHQNTEVIALLPSFDYWK